MARREGRRRTARRSIPSTSAQTSSASSDNRARFPRRRSGRAGERSTAVRRAPAALKLRRLAAGSGAEVGHAKPAYIAEQARRQAPPRRPAPTRRLGKARKRRHGAMGDGPHRAGRQQRRPSSLSAHVSGSLFTVRSRAGSWPWAPAMARAVCLAVVLVPARNQPRRRVESQPGRAQRAAPPSRARRRNTALTRPA